MIVLVFRTKEANKLSRMLKLFDKLFAMNKRAHVWLKCFNPKTKPIPIRSGALWVMGFSLIDLIIVEHSIHQITIPSVTAISFTLFFSLYQTLQTLHYFTSLLHYFHGFCDRFVLQSIIKKGMKQIAELEATELCHVNIYTKQ